MGTKIVTDDSFQADVIGAFHHFLERHHGFAHAGVVHGADVEEEILERLRALLSHL